MNTTRTTTTSTATTTPRSARLLSAGAALTVTFLIFQSVALYGKPQASQQMAKASPAHVTVVASAR